MNTDQFMAAQRRFAAKLHALLWILWTALGALTLNASPSVTAEQLTNALRSIHEQLGSQLQSIAKDEHAVEELRVEIAKLSGRLDEFSRWVQNNESTRSEKDGGFHAKVAGIEVTIKGIENKLQQLSGGLGSETIFAKASDVTQLQTTIQNLQAAMQKTEVLLQSAGDLALVPKIRGDIELIRRSLADFQTTSTQAMTAYTNLISLRNVDPTNAASPVRSTVVSNIHEDAALNLVWTLITGFLVMFMQAGFAMVETGFVRAKNAAHTMAMNLMVYSLSMLAYWAIGFGLQMGGIGDGRSPGESHSLGGGVFQNLNAELGFSWNGRFFGLMGGTGFFLPPGLLEGGVFVLFLFNMVFMDTAATIPTGALAERWRFLPFCLYSLAMGAFIYPVYANWVWGGGWLASLGKNFGLGHGVVDFAGSSVVHLCGGTIAFVGARMLGPRNGRYELDGSINKMPLPHNIPFGVLGTFILAFGWFGFNAGSTLSGNDSQIGVIATNTMLSSAAGAVVGMIATWHRYNKPDVIYMCNGMLAGLVAITAPCAFVSSLSAVLIGSVAGVLVFRAALLLDRHGIDDPVGAIAVHGVCGAWGMVALGLFANGRYGTGWNGVGGPVRGVVDSYGWQLLAQCIGVVICVVSVGFSARVIFWLIGMVAPHRSTDDEQSIGLDLAELGISAYDPMPPSLASADHEEPSFR